MAGVTFYNPGNRINCTIPFDHPTNDVKTVNLIAYFPLDVPAQSFCEIPTQIAVNTTDGDERNVSVDFATRFMQIYRDYGVIRVDAKRALANPGDPNLASTEKEAKEKGTRLWRDYLESKAREHIANVDRNVAGGAVPTRAQGVYAHALKTLGIADPADKVGVTIQSIQNVSEMSALQSQLVAMQKQIEALTAPKGK